MAYFDEEKLAQNILEDGFMYGIPSPFEIQALAKYYRKQGKGKIGIRNLLVDKCTELDDSFNEVLYFDIIKDAINRAMREEFKKISPVVIYQEELDKIRTYKISKFNACYLLLW